MIHIVVSQITFLTAIFLSFRRFIWDADTAVLLNDRLLSAANAGATPAASHVCDVYVAEVLQPG